MPRNVSAQTGRSALLPTRVKTTRAFAEPTFINRATRKPRQRTATSARNQRRPLRHAPIGIPPPSCDKRACHRDQLEKDAAAAARQPVLIRHLPRPAHKTAARAPCAKGMRPLVLELSREAFRRWIQVWLGGCWLCRLPVSGADVLALIQGTPRLMSTLP